MALNLIALGVLGSYFGIIIALLVYIARSLLAVKSTREANCALGRTRIWLFAFLAFVSFLHTWYHMFAFMKWSFDDYEAWAATLDSSLIHRISNWTTNTALFEQAWAIVCASAMNWWWSEQLCIFTAGAWTIFLYSESRRCRIPHAWAYMLLGQLVAISVASNLFYLAILLHAPLNPTSSSPSLDPYHAPLISVWWPIALSLRTIYNTPTVSGTPSFLSNLLIMHALLVIPLLAKKTTSSSPSPLSKWFSTKHLCAVTVAISLYIRARTLLPIIFPTGPPIIPSAEDIKALAITLIETLYSHPAQSSIGFDVVWTTISFLAWFLLNPHARKGVFKRIVGVVLMLAACLVLSIGVVAPAYLFFTIPIPPADPDATATGVQGASSTGKRESKDKKGAVGPDSNGARDAVDANNIAIVNEISSDI